MTKLDKQKSPYSELTRKLKGSDYGDAINTLQTDLGLLETSGAEMEALLIYMVNRRYRRSRNVDITLMALGLLIGYNNRADRLEPSEERDRYAERREKFLEKTNFIAIKYGNQAKTYAEAKQTLVKNKKSGELSPLIKTIRKTLDSSTTKCLVSVLTELYDEKDDVNEHLEKTKDVFQKRACENGLKGINWPELDHIPPELLPPLKYYEQSPDEASLSQPYDTGKNLNSVDKKDSAEATQEVASDPTEPVEPASGLFTKPTAGAFPSLPLEEGDDSGDKVSQSQADTLEHIKSALFNFFTSLLEDSTWMRLLVLTMLLLRLPSCYANRTYYVNRNTGVEYTQFQVGISNWVLPEKIEITPPVNNDVVNSPIPGSMD